VKFFKHNDVADLERVLKAVLATDKKYDQSLSQRRMVIVEGVYANSGQLCPLPAIAELCDKYKFRLCVDETLSFGVLGATGRGITEHYGLPVSTVDVLLGSNATSLAGVGGFCVGSREVVDHQRLSASGYCFSASAPPFTCAIACKSLELLEEDASVLRRLVANTKTLHAGISSIPGVEVISAEVSPIVHFTLTALRHRPDLKRDQITEALEGVVMQVRRHGVLCTRKQDVSSEDVVLEPTIRVASSALLTPEDIAVAVQAVRTAVTSAEVNRSDAQPAKVSVVMNGHANGTNGVSHDRPTARTLRQRK